MKQYILFGAVLATLIHGVSIAGCPSSCSKKATDSGCSYQKNDGCCSSYYGVDSSGKKKQCEGGSGTNSCKASSNEC